jgi:hypothetical protein
MFPLLSSYVGFWTKDFGFRASAAGVDYLVFVMPSDFVENSDLPLRVFNGTNYHMKWALMLLEALKTAPITVEWFIAMDDDTIPIVDNIARYLASFPRPREVEYFVHGPGERQSQNRLGNGGGGFFVSRALLENSKANLTKCVKGMSRRIFNGDIRLDTCFRRHRWAMPQFEVAMFHLDPKALRGNLVGLIEGFMSRVGVLSIHHIAKVGFDLYPIDFLLGAKTHDVDTLQIGMFVNAAGMLQTKFLERYITKLGDGRVAVLNDGYSIAIFPKEDWTAIEEYLVGVETTFGVTEPVVFWELKDFLVKRNPYIVRYFAVKFTRDNGTLEEEFVLETNVREKVRVLHKEGSVELVFPK